MDPAAYLLLVAGGIIAGVVVLTALIGLLFNKGNDPLTMNLKVGFLAVAAAAQVAGCIVEAF